LVFEIFGFKSRLQKIFSFLVSRILTECCTAAELTSGLLLFKRSYPLNAKEVTVISASDPVYVARRQADGTWSIVDIKSGQVADIGGCVLRRLDAAMAAGLVRDLNETATLGFDRRMPDRS
jgi:hypothetical protein